MAIYEVPPRLPGTCTLVGHKLGDRYARDMALRDTYGHMRHANIQLLFLILKQGTPQGHNGGRVNQVRNGWEHGKVNSKF